MATRKTTSNSSASSNAVPKMSPEQKVIYDKLIKKGLTPKQAFALSKQAAKRKAAAGSPSAAPSTAKAPAKATRKRTTRASTARSAAKPKAPVAAKRAPATRRRGKK